MPHITVHGGPSDQRAEQNEVTSFDIVSTAVTGSGQVTGSPDVPGVDAQSASDVPDQVDLPTLSASKGEWLSYAQRTDPDVDFTGYTKDQLVERYTAPGE